MMGKEQRIKGGECSIRFIVVINEEIKRDWMRGKKKNEMSTLGLDERDKE